MFPGVEDLRFYLGCFFFFLLNLQWMVARGSFSMPQSEQPMAAPSLLCLVEVSGSLHTLGTLRWSPLATHKRDSHAGHGDTGFFLQAIYTWLLNSDLSFPAFVRFPPKVHLGI